MTPKPPPKGSSQWDVLDDAPALEGVSPEIAHALLETNPALREKGLNTNLVVEQSRRSGGAPAATKPSGATAQASILGAVDKLKVGLATEDKQIADEIAALQQKRAQLKTHAADKLIRWLLQNDPELRSPLTQQVLDSEKPFLDGIGFSVKRYIDARKKGAT